MYHEEKGIKNHMMNRYKTNIGITVTFFSESKREILPCLKSGTSFYTMEGPNIVGEGIVLEGW